MAQTAASLTGEVSAGSRQSDFAFLLQVCRPGLWTTTALFYLMPLGHSIDFRSKKFWVGLIYMLIPLGFVLYGVNDIFDAEADRLNPRKGTFLFGSLGRREQLAALRWQIVALQVPFVAAFLVWIGAQTLLWFGVLLVAVALYNAPRIGLKARPPFDVLMQASYLLVFVLSSWVNRVPQLPWQTFIFGALFAMHSHLFGEVMDIVPDRESGRTTTAVRIGAVWTKLLMTVFLSVEVALVVGHFHDRVIGGFLAAGAVWFVADALWLWRNKPYSPKVMTVFMWMWNAAALLLIVWDYMQRTLTRSACLVL
jgi:4-hydroxybenzoate polyprenyltransferase